jgi:acyl-CoA synthetase (AMP-forming)/AMP-acid ligase II
VNPTLWQLVEERARATPDALFAIDDQDRQLTFAGFRDRVQRVAAALAELGASAATPVAWMLPTSLEAMVLLSSLARLGAVQCPLMPSYGQRELAFILRQTGARFVVAPRVHRGHERAALVHASIADFESPPRVVELTGALPEAEPGRLGPAPQSADDVRFIYYTSGTTADPKGVRHSDATLYASATGLVAAFELGPDDRAAMVFPFAHVGGALWLIASLLSGAAAIVVDPWGPSAIDALVRHGVTQAGAGTVFHQAYLAAQRARPGAPLFPRVRAFPGGGAPKPPALHFEMKRELGGAGIVSGYGLTECPAITMCHTGDPDDKLADTEGRASPRGRGRVRVVGADERDLSPGHEGEVRVHGPQLFKGYVDVALNDGAFDAQGFFRTGDLGVLDAEGHLRVTGRLKDVIIRKGENISAQEIENLLYEHPDVSEVAVVGVPDAALGEMCCAVVVPRNATRPPALAELTAFLTKRGLMRQKLPERLEVVRELPRNANGKVDKRALRSAIAT